ncbi:hypothetical protein FKM82_022649 [Ascaphus truei]
MPLLSRCQLRRICRQEHRRHLTLPHGAVSAILLPTCPGLKHLSGPREDFLRLLVAFVGGRGREKPPTHSGVREEAPRLGSPASPPRSCLSASCLPLRSTGEHTTRARASV